MQMFEGGDPAATEAAREQEEAERKRLEEEAEAAARGGDDQQPEPQPGDSDGSPSALAQAEVDALDAAEAAAAAAEPEPPAPARPLGRLRIGEDTKGRYVVLWARKPKRGDQERPSYQEVDVVKAHSPEAAKRIVMGDLKAEGYDAPHAAFLKHSAAQKPGILLRAVPAMHWPDTVVPTTYVRPEPVLTIG